jgi:hypothetical protein
MSTPSLLNIPYLIKAGTLYSQIPETGAGDFVVTRVTSPATNRSTRINADGFIELVNDNVPRLDYPLGGAVNGCPALLVEPAATNLLFRSEEFDNAYWLKGAGGVASAPVVTLNAEISPDGTMNADRVVFNLNGGVLAADISSLESPSITHAAAAHVQSVYARTTDGTNKAFTFVTPSGSSALITITPIWQRFIVTGTLAATANFRLRLRGTEGTASSATIALWGAQYETGSVPTSYIPTTTQAITRATDVIDKTNIASLIGQSQGTVYMEVELTRFGVARLVFHVNIGNTNQYFQLTQAANNNFQVLLVNTSGNSTIITTSAFNTPGVYKIAFGYQSGNYALYINGNSVGTSNNTTNFPTSSLTRLILSDTILGSLRDRIRAVALYPNRLSNAELIALTTP